MDTHLTKCWLVYVMVKSKIRQITRPRFAIWKIIADSWMNEWMKSIYLPVVSIAQLMSITDIICPQWRKLNSYYNSTSIHQFYYSASTRLKSLTFSIRLDDKSRVRTPLRRYLVKSFLSFNQIILFCSTPSLTFERKWKEEVDSCQKAYHDCIISKKIE